ncbi:MAG: hypothetical protein HOE76_02180, partial [Euryarchaeota archaeon]|nr:hypothetical protein [Euryarchaeota archaeon]
MSESGEPNRIADIIENSKNRTRELREILLRTLEPIVEELVHYMVKECVSRDYFQFIISLPVSSETNYSHSFVDKLYSAARSNELGISPNTIFGQLQNDRSNHGREYRARAAKHAFDSCNFVQDVYADRVFQRAKLLLDNPDNGVDWPFDSDTKKRFFQSGDYELLMSLHLSDDRMRSVYERYLIDHPHEFTAEIGQTVIKKSDSELVNWSDFKNVLKRIFSSQKGRFTEHKGVFHDSYFSTFVRESDWGDLFRIPNVPSGFEEGDIPLFEISSDFEEFNVLSDHYEQFQMDSVEKNSNVEPEETHHQELETVEV